ncbi:SGNH/GDSL hydrolase family protein (plasmid) [Sinorhizobium sp. B11]
MNKMLPLLSVAAAVAFSPAYAAVGSYYKPHFDARLMVVYTNTMDVGKGNVMLIGDSNTEMFRPTEVSDCHIVNAGLAGARISDVAERADALAEMQRPVIAHIMVGTNDALTNLKSTVGGKPEWDAMGDNVGKIIDAFKSRAAIVVVWSLPPPGASLVPRDNFDYINKLLAKVADSKRVKFENSWDEGMVTSDNVAAPGWLIQDDTHLSSKGQEVRAKRMKRIDDRLLKRYGAKCRQ